MSLTKIGLILVAFGVMLGIALYITDNPKSLAQELAEKPIIKVGTTGEGCTLYRYQAKNEYPVYFASCKTETHQWQPISSRPPRVKENVVETLDAKQ